MKNSVCLIVAVLGCAVMGCSAMNDSRKMGHSMVNSMFPTPENRADSHDDENRVDRDHEKMMLEARKGLPTSKENDEWFANFFFSPEHRSINKSLGVEY